MIRMGEYIGCPVSRLLETEPFKGWQVESSVEDLLEDRIIDYGFEGHGMDVVCDDQDIVKTIFLYSEERGGFDQSLLEIPFTWSREQVLDHFGAPAASAQRSRSPILGESGAWDRFRFRHMTVHVEYRLDTDQISKITLMGNEVVPGFQGMG